MDIGEWIVVHRLSKVDGVENLDVIAMLQQSIAALDDNAAFRESDVKIEKGNVTNYFQLGNCLFLLHHASVASFCPPECPCSPC